MSNKIQRNFECPCGSGKKHKHCCMAQPEKVEPRPAAAGGVEYPSKVKGAVPVFSNHTKSLPTPNPMPKVRGAFGKPGRHRHPVDHSPVTDPRFLSRSARDRLTHVSHS